MPKKIPPPLPSGNPEKRNNGVQINDSKITYWFIPPEIGALQISLLQKNILGVVATFTRNGGECWATDVQFGEAFQWSRQKINSAINGMVAAGWLRKDVTRLSNGTTPRRLWLASPPIPLSPTVTSSITDPSDLVTHGDYPCHLGGLPLSPTVTTLVTHGDTNSNIIKKEKVIKEIVADAPTPTYEYPLSLEEPQDAEVPQESDSVKEPIEISEAPPLPAAPPTAKKAKQPESGWSDVQAAATPEQWESIEMWRKHRTQMKKPCTPLSIMQNLKKYGSDLSAAIEHSIEKGWQGIFSPSQNGTHGKEPLTAGLTDKEIDLRLDFIWAHYKDSPIVPVRPFKDLAEENFVIDVLRSIFGDDYEEAIKKRRTDEKSFYQSAFRNKYKQGVENTKV